MLGFIPFITGLIGITAFVLFRLWEAQRTERFFEQARKSLDSVAERLYRVMVFGEIPRHYRTKTATVLRFFSHHAIHTAVLALRSIERPLTRMSHRMRMSSSESKQEPSDFLKTITPDKKDGKSGVDSV
ncbi:hypothetical protein COU15_03330 [Candidatus Kaiserbacteria bacterium CG10_big_fil_rev_8_21_14_0_10_45_20]|uniref:Uncharacterized protein n=1 Tax=Candidatus Kaiserbacteria bacterium CG10_big_fil_rev_8_21_14_0_10_45_20 TaxID=1974607 RepID=A0A2H0UEV6_9BACT|nr:MAG: hypothetical protein COU15_03330 [Candidatus Kaiserbacteria bacterium CG10_big_fil_rev_8_21_14_0_10_45_20]